MTRTFISALHQSALSYPTLPAFRIPVVCPSTKTVLEWKTVTFAGFVLDVERSARYWAMKLASDGLPPRSVVALWLGGHVYDDLLHVYGIMRAGYVPQLFSLRLPNPQIIFKLMAEVNASALIHDPAYSCVDLDAPVPLHPALRLNDIPDVNYPLPPWQQDLRPDDLYCVFHSSGSTSGVPKVIPVQVSWVDFNVEKAAFVCRSPDSGRQDVTTWLGSITHIAQTFMLCGALQNGACTVFPTSPNFSSDELLDMVTRCSLTSLRQFGSFLSIHMRSARCNRQVLDALLSLREVLYVGIAISKEDEAFAFHNGMKLHNMFGTTEMGAMLYTAVGERFLREIPGAKYAFWPKHVPQEPSISGRDGGLELLELIVLGDSLDCPHPKLRGLDGHYHTGDLFEQVEPGLWRYRFRDDDWLKMENSLKCDTLAIEDEVRTLCAELVGDCIVVGSGRPSPALFVEPSLAMSGAQLKVEIIKRLDHVHSGRYLHERIVDPRFILVMPPKSLPRTATKGNIRRKAVEDMFRARLDDIYSAA